MKKQLIATLVGGIIIFLLQFLSWSLLNVHGNEIRYTANQDQIMTALAQNLEEGQYFLPRVAPGTSKEAEQAAMEAYKGRPWATISYHKAMDMDMGGMLMSMFRALAVDLIAIFLLSWLLLRLANLDFKTALLGSMAVGGIGYLTIPYLNSIWFDTNSIGYLVDALVQWGLVGLWLGWYLTRRSGAA